MDIWKRSLLYFVTYTFLLGGVYPALITILSQTLFPAESNGSLVLREGVQIGSSLIGQEFKDNRYFWGRPSLTAPVAYNAASSGASNFSITNPALQSAYVERAGALSGTDLQIPVDLIAGSGSGLDPHISVASAKFQIPRVSRSRGIEEAKLREIVHSLTEQRLFGLFGEPRVNVLLLNLSLDKL